LKREREGIPRVFLPTLSKRKVKRKTVSTTIGMESEKKMKREAKSYFIIECMKKIGIIHNVGCRRDERIALLRSANEAVEKTSKRRINAAQKPKRKNLIQRAGFPRKTLMISPRKINPNHNRLEKKERPKQRLKLKTWSVFIQL